VVSITAAVGIAGGVFMVGWPRLRARRAADEAFATSAESDERQIRQPV
jgi:hypothetical protein